MGLPLVVLSKVAVSKVAVSNTDDGCPVVLAGSVKCMRAAKAWPIASTDNHWMKFVELLGHTETSQMALSHNTPVALMLMTFCTDDVAKSVSTDSVGVTLP